MSLNRFRNAIENRIKRLDKAIAIEESKLNDVPEGRIRVVQEKGITRHYHVTSGGNNTGTYIPDSDPIIARLIQKRYDQKVLAAALKERELLIKTLNRYPDIPFEDVIGNTVEARGCSINPIIMTDEEFLRKWENTPYTPKPIGDDVPVIITDKGERVRSKSEKIIADRLFRRNVAYKYECPHKLKNNVIVHPDFTILNMRTREERYLEHSGMLDDPRYANSLVIRTNKYAMSGIILGVNLFMLFETDRIPIDSRVLDRVIDQIIS
ncbi:hypothetical protein SAMN02910456_00705 [Ruminococcaceae bacterium YRB3002]|nr:hypothetical protein SAMN02910456_00705 [Ruminococcaceae bacterium YRB3002]